MPPSSLPSFGADMRKAAAALRKIFALALCLAGLVHAQPAGARGYAEDLKAAGIPLYPSTLPALYFSNSDWADRALDMVSSAKDYILISSFLINAHPVNAPIMDTLVRKAGEGVRVYVMFDSSSYFTYMPDGTTYLPAPVRNLEGTAVHVAEFNPITGAAFFALPSLLERDHRKFWIVDGKSVASGGMNFNYYSFSPPGPCGNIDTFIEVGGKDLVVSMVASFCETWNENSPEAIDAADFDVQASLAESSVWLANQTLDRASLIDPLFDTVFRNARKEIWMLQSYAFPTGALIRKVKEATKRGVAVHIVLSTNSFRMAYENAAYYRSADLIEAGAMIHIFDAPDKTFLHYKLMLADDDFAVYGSPNFNYRSQYLSRELAVATQDSRTIQATRENLQLLLRYAPAISLEQARSYKSLKYLAAYLGMLFGG